MAIEEKQIIRDFKDYMISSKGEVFSLKSNKKLSPSKCHGGYLHVSLFKDNKRFTRNIHRLVAETFIPNPKNKPLVLHKDDNPSNNEVSNLEWGDQIKNQQDSWKRNRKQKVLDFIQANCHKLQQWSHSVYGEYTGSASELIKAYPEQNLNISNLRKLVSKYENRTQHKGWRVVS